MMVEGRGMVPPVSIAIGLSRGEIAYLRSVSVRIDEFRGYARASSQWQQGYVQEAGFIGRCGEWATVRWLNARGIHDAAFDAAVRPAGDGGRDVLFAPLAIQIKTNQRLDRPFLIRRVDRRKRLLPYRCDAFVFATLLRADRQVHLRGWMPAPEVSRRCRLERSPRDVHFNNVVPVNHLYPMAHLLELISLERPS